MTRPVELAGPPANDLPRTPLAEPLVVRQRLLDALDGDERLILLRAPLGFGKSSLLRLWADSARDGSRDIVPVAMGPAHNTGEDLWRVATVAMRGAAPLPRRPENAADRFQELLLSRPRPITLVVDRIDRVIDEELVRRLLELLDTTPRLRLVLSARDDFGLALGPREQGPVDTLAAHGHVISGRDLLMTADEVGDVLASAGLRLTGRHALDIYAVSGGWPRLVRTLVRALAETTGEVDERETCARVLRGHLQRDILAVITPEESAILQLLGVPRRLTAGSAAVVVGAAVHEAGSMLEGMAQSGLIGVRETDGERVYVWPESMHEALREEVAVDPERLATLDRALARHYARGDLRSAIVHATWAGDAGLVGELLHAHWLELYVYRTDVLSDLFATTPQEWYDDPLLRSLRDLVLRVPGDEAARIAVPDDLARHAADPDVRDVLDLALVGVFRLRRARRFGEALALATELQALAIDARTTQPRAVDPLFAPIVQLSGMLEEIAGDLDRAIRMFRLGVEHTTSSTLRGSARHIAAHLAMDLALVGEYDEAQTWAARSESSATVRGWVSSRATIATTVAELLIAVSRDDAARAREAQRRLLVVGVDPLDELWPQVTYARAQYALLWGNALSGVQQVLGERTARPGWGRGWAMEPMLRAAEADLLLALGYVDRAHALLGDGDLEDEAPLLDVARARTALLSGDGETAQAVVHRRMTNRAVSLRVRDELLVIEAVARLRVGNAASAATMVAQALASDPEPPARAFALVPRRDLHELAERVPALAEVVRHLEKEGVDDVFPISAAPVRLTRREQVVLRYLASGLTRDEIAHRLTVSSHTVKSQTHSIYRKLGARSRTEAVLMARERRLLDLRDRSWEDDELRG